MAAVKDILEENDAESSVNNDKTAFCSIDENGNEISVVNDNDKIDLNFINSLANWSS